MKKQKKYNFSFTTSYIIIIIAFLVIINVALGLVVLNQCGTILITLIQNRMLDISNTAADMLDGDILEKITSRDLNSKEYKTIMKTLRLFQENIDLQYIYCVRDLGNKKFVFIIDPDPENPAEFGEPIIYTDALYRASLGNPSVDDIPYDDKWGSFYSSYTPVFNSAGKVAGIVAVDFGSEWYQKQLRDLFRSIIVVSIFSFIIGALIVFILNSKLRKRFVNLYDKLSELAENIEQLIAEIDNFSNYSGIKTKSKFEEIEFESENNKDDIDILGNKILSMQNYLKEQIEIAHEQAYIDALTSVGNKTAYMDLTKHLDKMIIEGIAVFSVAVFDLNGLKTINDNYGHECGDLALIDAGKILISVFGRENLYRIGGDEFIAVIKQLSDSDSDKEMNLLFRRLDEKLIEENQTVKKYKIPLAIAKGYALYTPGNDKEYKEVFKRADQKMYDDKVAYYNRYGNCYGNFRRTHVI